MARACYWLSTTIGRPIKEQRFFLATQRPLIRGSRRSCSVCNPEPTPRSSAARMEQPVSPWWRPMSCHDAVQHESEDQAKCQIRITSLRPARFMCCRNAKDKSFVVNCIKHKIYIDD